MVGALANPVFNAFRFGCTPTFAVPAKLPEIRTVAAMSAAAISNANRRDCVMLSVTVKPPSTHCLPWREVTRQPHIVLWV